MSVQVIEGTWEEIKRRESELVGRYLRVTIRPENLTQRKPAKTNAKPKIETQPKKLVGFGAFADSLPSTEEYMREKQTEIELEERNL